MANILISSLGTGQKGENGYRTAIYSYQGKEVETPFISKALCKMLKIDRLYLVGTKGSIWDSAYKEFSLPGEYSEETELALYGKIDAKNITEQDLELVNRTIDKKLGTQGSQCFLIDYGLDDTQLWANFEKYIEILKHIDDKDTVYIDITHAFRSLSLMSFLMVQFGQTIEDKKFSIGGVFYGMFEAPQMRESDGKSLTPVVDLKILYDLMEWIKAINNFKNYANGDHMATLLENVEEYKSEYNIFNNYTNSMRIANMAAVKRNIDSIAAKLELLEQSQNPIIRLMTDEMRSFVKRLNKENMSDFQLALAEWYCEHKHYALSYMTLAEAIVSKSCEYFGYKVNGEKSRNEAKGKIYQMDKSFFKEVYKSVNQIRNNICHQLEKRENAILSDIKNLPGYLKRTKNFFKKIQ